MAAAIDVHIASNDELLDFFHQEHAVYINSTAAALEDRRARAQELREICLHQDPATRKLYKTRVAAELPAVARELTTEVSETEAAFEAEVFQGIEGLKPYCRPDVLFFEMGKPPFPHQEHEDHEKWKIRIGEYFEDIDPGLADTWLRN